MSVPFNAAVRPDANTPTHRDQLSDVERHILASLHALRFGALEIVVHDSRIVQIETREKLRFDVKGRPLTDSLS